LGCSSSRKSPGPLLLLGLGLIIWRTRATSRTGSLSPRLRHHLARLIIQNILAQLVTGPWSRGTKSPSASITSSSSPFRRHCSHLPLPQPQTVC
jgi:hypothetical protein